MAARSAVTIYMVQWQEADVHLTPSRLLLRLREARAAAANAASGARAAASAAEMRQATAEAAEQRTSAALLAAEQRGHALDEQCRRLQARLGRTEVDLVRTGHWAAKCTPASFLLTCHFHQARLL